MEALLTIDIVFKAGKYIFDDNGENTAARDTRYAIRSFFCFENT
jgi:hypothetical protein